jgi:hypothetical protein
MKGKRLDFSIFSVKCHLLMSHQHGGVEPPSHREDTKTKSRVASPTLSKLVLFCRLLRDFFLQMMLGSFVRSLLSNNIIKVDSTAPKIDLHRLASLLLKELLNLSLFLLEASCCYF